jgi:predicted esterase
VVGATVALCAFAHAPVGAQKISVARGTLAERIISPSDSTQSYAVYLPSGYQDSRDWPILFLLDPRGRALLPLRLFRAAAERNGWILISSWNTLSDGPGEPNVNAINAMLADAAASFSLHDQRYYLAGFSGTARVAWVFAGQLHGRVAGIFGASAGAESVRSVLAGPPARVPFFGTAGILDFNHDEMHRFGERLDSWALPHRIRFFDGAHAWPPDSIAAAAVDWFDLQAIRAGLLENSAAIDRLFARDTAAARALEATGDLAGAMARFAEIARDYDGFRDVAPARERAASLARNRTVQRLLDRRRELLEENARRERRLFDYLDRVRRTARPPSRSSALRELDIARLQRTAAGTDTLEAQAATRSLEQIFVATSFYVPRDLIARGDPARALAILEIAGAIHPANPQVLISRARALARMGRDDAARAALDSALAAGAPHSAFETDSVLARLLRR